MTVVAVETALHLVLGAAVTAAVLLTAVTAALVAHSAWESGAGAAVITGLLAALYAAGHLALATRTRTRTTK